MADGSSTSRQRLVRTLGRRGLLAALVTAGGLYALLLVQGTLSALTSSLSQLSVLGLGAGGGAVSDITDLGQNLASTWGYQVQSSLLTDLPFAVGVFLSLWQILPIAPELRFAHVVTRALFAGAIGAIAVLLVGVVQTIVLAASAFSGVDLGRASSAAGHALGAGLVGSILHAAQTWIGLVPLVVLAGLLLWGWLQRFPPKHPVTGVVDEL